MVSAKSICQICRTARKVKQPTPPRCQRSLLAGMMCYMQILLYSAPWCRDCREAKRFLDENGISYTEIDIETVDGAAEEVLRHVGKRAIPQLVIDGKWFQPYRPGHGLLYHEMREVLGLTVVR